MISQLDLKVQKECSICDGDLCKVLGNAEILVPWLEFSLIFEMNGYHDNKSGLVTPHLIWYHAVFLVKIMILNSVLRDMEIYCKRKTRKSGTAEYRFYII